MSDSNKKTPQPEIASTFRAGFFVMPDVYRHGKDVVMIEPKQEEKKTVVSTPAPAPVAPPPASPVKQPLTQPAASGSTTKALLVAGVIVLIALGVGGYLVVRSLQKQPVVQTPPPVVSQPRPAPEPEPAPVVTTEPEPIVPVVEPARQVVPGRDIDSDGVSDTEEQLVYGSNPNLPDTDADGFLDGNEVFHQYNPNGTAPGTLVGSGVALEHVQGNVKVVYPSMWTIGQRTNDEDPAFLNGLLFISTTGEQIRVDFSSIGFNPEELANDWKAGFEEKPVSSSSKTGFRLFVTTDNLQAFLVVGTQALRFEYDPGLKTTVEYLQTFQMMINSVTSTTAAATPVPATSSATSSTSIPQPTPAITQPIPSEAGAVTEPSV